MSEIRKAKDYVGKGLRDYDLGQYLGEITGVSDQGMEIENGEVIVGFSCLGSTCIGGIEYAPKYELTTSKTFTVDRKPPFFHIIKKQRATDIEW